MTSLENQIPPPLLMLIVAVAMWGASLVSPALIMSGAVRGSLAGVFVVIAGLKGAPAFRAVSRARTTFDPVHIERATTLVTTGVYRLTRNPMYVALTSLLLSWAAWLAAPLALAGPLLFVIGLTRFQIVPEERAMTAKFGAAYADYKSRVRRWV
jgi:protein-S-isoprenylcysteine O-methyltransferase Ste14